MLALLLVLLLLGSVTYMVCRTHITFVIICIIPITGVALTAASTLIAWKYVSAESPAFMAAQKDKFIGAFTSHVVGANAMSSAARNFRWDYTYTENTTTKAHHGHSMLADNRRETENNMNRLAQLLAVAAVGRDDAEPLWDATNNVSAARFDVQSSGNRARSPGTWSMYSEGDFLQSPRNDEPNPVFSVSTFVDVIDHDGEGVHFTKHAGRPLMMYRRIPNSLAGKTTESRWYTNESGTFTEIVHQGAKYTTGLWTFEDVVRITEHPTARGLWSLLLPRTTYYKTHTIIPHSKDPTRQLQILIPHATTSIPPAILRLMGACGYIDRASPPIRENFAVEHGSFMMAQYDRVNSTVVSLQWIGDTSGSSVELPVTTWLNLNAAKDRPYFTVSNVKGWIQSRADEDRAFDLSQDQMELLAIAILAKAQPRAYRVSTLFGRRAFASYHVADTPLKVSGEHAMPPITGGSVRAILDEAAGEAAYESRVVAFENNVVPPEYYTKFASEFVERFVSPFKGRLAPMEIAEVKEAQDGKLQRVRNTRWDNETFDVPDDATMKGTLKKETIGENKTPRWTMTMPTSLSVLCGAFSKAFTRAFYGADHIAHFWSPGQNKSQTGAQIGRLYSSFPRHEKRGTDYSGWDMSQSEWIDEYVTRPCFVLPFQARYSIAATRYAKVKHDANVELRVRNEESKGQIARFIAKGRRITGADDTTNSNTIANAFADYCALRLEEIEPDDAFAMIGPKYGDDSITIADPKSAEQVAKDLGFRMKWERCDLGDEFCEAIRFLGRVYPKPAETPLSFPDPEKFIRNWTLVAAGKPDAMYHKWVGWMVSDGDAPGLIGNVLATTARVLRFRMPAKLSVWLSKNKNVVHKDERRRIAEGSTSYDGLPADAVGLAMQKALRTVISEEQYAQLEQKLAQASTPEHMRSVYIETCPSSGEEGRGQKAIFA